MWRAIHQGITTFITTTAMLLLEGPKFARFSFYPSSSGAATSEETPFTILGHRIVLAPPRQSVSSVSANDEHRTEEEDSHTARTASSVWDCSIVLSKYMETLAVRQPGFWRSKRVLELGAGQGIVSLGAIALGAASVTITDLESALPTIQDSIQLNEFATNKETHPGTTTTTATTTATTQIHLMGLDWVHHTRDLAKISARLVQDGPSILAPTTPEGGIETGTVAGPVRFPLDYILASDVVWVDYLIPSLVETMAELLGVSTKEEEGKEEERIQKESSLPCADTAKQQHQHDQHSHKARDAHPSSAPTPTPAAGTSTSSSWPVILLAHQTRSTRGDKILFDSLERLGLAKKPIHLDRSDPGALDPDEPAAELQHVFQDPLFRKPNITLWKIWRKH